MLVITSCYLLQGERYTGTGDAKGNVQPPQPITEDTCQKHDACRISDEREKFASTVAGVGILDVAGKRTLKEANDDADDQDAYYGRNDFAHGGIEKPILEKVFHV